MVQKDVNAVKLLFQLSGDLVEKSQTTHEYLSRQDKIDRINNLLHEANEKQKTWKKVQSASETADAIPSNTDIGNEPHGDQPRTGIA